MQVGRTRFRGFPRFARPPFRLGIRGRIPRDVRQNHAVHGHHTVRTNVRQTQAICASLSTCVAASRRSDSAPGHPAYCSATTRGCWCPNTQRSWVADVNQEYRCPHLRSHPATHPRRRSRSGQPQDPSSVPSRHHLPIRSTRGRLFTGGATTALALMVADANTPSSSRAGGSTW
jgi:hypothetical protein